MPISVLLVEDSNVMRTAIKSSFAQMLTVELAGEAENFVQAIEMANTIRPQVIVLDLSLSIRDGMTPIDIKSALGGWPVVAISFAIDDWAQELAKSIGATTLLDKMKLREELVPAITQSVSQNSQATP